MPRQPKYKRCWCEATLITISGSAQDVVLPAESEAGAKRAAAKLFGSKIDGLPVVKIIIAINYVDKWVKDLAQSGQWRRVASCRK